MQEARNVVEFSQSRRTAGPVSNRVLDDCGELAANRLVEALGAALEAAGKELHRLAAHTHHHEMSMLYLQGMEFLRDHASAIEIGFRQTFFKEFKRSCRKGLVAANPANRSDTQLSLMAPEDLEETLAVNNLANALHNACGEELFGLNQRIGILLDRRDLGSEDNPLGPEVIGKAILDTFKERDSALKVRLALVPMLNKHLPERVKVVYQTVNRFLVDKGVLPTLRIGLKKGSRPFESSTGEQGDAGSAPQNPDLLSVLQQLLTAGARGVGPPIAGTPGVSGSPVPGTINPTGGGMAAGAATANAVTPPLPAGAVVSTAPVFVHTLTQLQRGQTEGLDLQGLDAAHLGNGQINVLRVIKNSGVAAGMGHLDAMTLDIVALIFDYILDDRRVPDAMKALIGRLQIPVLKVAMLDRNFFSQKHHPARRLLDMLAEVSMGWDAGEGHESGLYRKVDDIVQRILNDFDDKLDVFHTALADLEGYLAEEKRQIDAHTARGAQLLYTREQREIAETIAYDTIHTQLFGHPTPALIQDFLHGTWRQLLTLVYSQSGEDSEAWRGAVQTMSDLIWSVAPKTTAEDRRQLVQRLPGLLKRLSDGFKTLETAQAEQDRFFAALVKCHAEAVKSGLKGPTAEMATEPAIDTQETRRAASSVSCTPAGGGWGAAQPWGHSEPHAPPQCPDPADFEEVPVPAEAVEVMPTVLEEVSALPILSQHADTEEITLTEVSWLAGGEPEGDRYDVMVRQLKRGSWIEFRQEDGNMARAKLAWISPMKGIYLFTNRLGQRAMSISASGLAAKLRDGQIQLLDDVPLMDRAMDALLSKLQNTA
jgi:hypothetical protein